MVKFLIIILTFVTFKTYACGNKNENNEMHIWLGHNSEFSKVFLKSKCVLDKQLEGVSPANRKLIVKLILKSYNTVSKEENLSF